MTAGTVFVVCVRSEAEREIAARHGAGAVILDAEPPGTRRVVPVAGGRAADLAAVLVLARAAADDAARRIVVVSDPVRAASVPSQDVAGVLFDGVRGLLDRHGLPTLADAAKDCRRRGLLFGFAGGLEPPDIPRLLPLAPDFLALGRAVRIGGAADGALDPASLRLAADLFPPAGILEAGPEIVPAGHPDRIFVRDLVLPVAVGAYASEVGRLQRVRFTVEAEVADPRRGAADMRDVVSYDLLADAVRQVAASTHVVLAEALAERVAGLVLRDPRIDRVRVVVEKLDLGPGAMGVEIWRGRAGRAVADPGV